MTAEALARHLGLTLARSRPLQGGDISQVRLLEFHDGPPLVIKRGPQVTTEGRMLQALAHAGAPVPALRHSEPGLIAMDFVAPGPGGDWHAFGAALKALHGNVGAGYGWSEDYAFGAVAIPAGITAGPARASWPDFWAEARLLQGQSDLPAALARRLEDLCQRLPDLLPDRPPPALLHGDLWQGNLLSASSGRLLMIDPACSHGDAEVDLAMLHLFGHPPAAFQQSYGPLAPGWQERRALYQLWPALVHLRLFGSGYAGLVTRLLASVGA